MRQVTVISSAHDPIAMGTGVRVVSEITEVDLVVKDV